MKSKQTPIDIASYIEHTNVDPKARRQHIRRLCEEATEYGFRAVVVAPQWALFARETLDRLQGPRKHRVLVGDVHNFPGLPAWTADSLADFHDIFAPCPNIHKNVALQNQFKVYLLQLAEKLKGPRRIIIETPMLENKDIVKMSKICRANGITVKSNSGRWPKRRSNKDILKLIKRGAKPWYRRKKNHTEIKISGGVKTYGDVEAMVELGADYIGTSNGLAIMGMEL